jgi:hypothetical protein
MVRRRWTSSISARNGDGGDRRALLDPKIRIVLTTSPESCPFMDTFAASQKKTG